MRSARWRPVNAAVAAGHPATADAGGEILAEGGSAADAAVAASLASCVAETVMTGLLGGGHAIYLDAATGRVREPRLLRRRARPRAERAADVELLELEVPFGTELVHYAVGAGVVRGPGRAGGARRALAAHGRLPWARLVRAGAAARARRRRAAAGARVAAWRCSRR